MNELLVFASPLPNRSVWNSTTFGLLQGQDFLQNGGWWHNPRILAAVGQGRQIEETRAWEGCWNEKIVELVRLSMEDDEAVTILLTGRQEKGFDELLGTMLATKQLEFDIVALKPSVSPTGEVFSSTMNFKQAILRDITFTYRQAQELRLYEDRPKHTKAFREFFDQLNTSLISSPSPERSPLEVNVIQVSEQEINMDPVSEVAEVQSMINVHNQALRDGSGPENAVPYIIKRSVFYTGYIISPADTEKLHTLVKLPANCSEKEMRQLANNILITPRPAPQSILNRVGGMGARVRWKVTGVAHVDHRVWAARVQCITPDTHIYTENKTPCVVLATRRAAKPLEASRIQNWQPVAPAQAFEFDTVVGEKVLLRIEQELPGEDPYEATFPHAKNARKHPREEDFPPLQPTSSRGRGNAAAADISPERSDGGLDVLWLFFGLLLPTLEAISIGGSDGMEGGQRERFRPLWLGAVGHSPLPPVSFPSQCGRRSSTSSERWQRCFAFRISCCSITDLSFASSKQLQILCVGFRFMMFTSPLGWFS
nr:uncharacterized protein c4.02c [Quercus suber]